MRNIKSPPCINVIYWAVLFLSFLIQLNVTEADSNSQTTVSVVPYASFAYLGQRFTITIKITEVENLYGVEVNLYWNSSILRIVSVDVRLGVESHPDGVLHEEVYIAKNETSQEKGEYLLAGTSVEPAPPFNGSGNIVRVVFEVVGFGDTKLDIETKLADWPPPDRDPRISWPIEHTTIDGFFDVTAPIIETPLCEPSGDIQPDQPVKVSVNVTDSASGLKNVTLLYTIFNGSTWKSIIMTYNSSTKCYEAIIPGQPAGSVVKFIILAYDLVDNLQLSGGDGFYSYKVVSETFNILILFPLLAASTISILFLVKRNRVKPFIESDKNESK